MFYAPSMLNRLQNERFTVYRLNQCVVYVCCSRDSNKSTLGFPLGLLCYFEHEMFNVFITIGAHPRMHGHTGA